MSLEERIAKLDSLIASFRELVRDYPKSDNYKETLEVLLKERAEAADTIGRTSQNK